MITEASSDEPRRGFSRRTVVLFFAGLAVLLALSATYIFILHYESPPIRSDGYGYYSYLPAIFIDHDLSFRDFVGHFPSGQVPHYTALRHIGETGRYLQIYPVGTALLQLPTFLVADGIAHLIGGGSRGSQFG